MKSARTRILLLASCAAVLGTWFVVEEGQSQRRRERRFAEVESRAISEPFRGIIAGGAVEPGLFPVRASGVSTAPVREAAQSFLAALNSEQRKLSTFPVDDIEWRRWANQHMLVRQGVQLKDMDDFQREAAFGLMKAGLSDKGYKLSRDIMKLNHSLAELTDNFVEYDEEFYYFTFMGEPSAEQPWGWQLDGHHLNVNYFVLGDQVVMAPTFMGSEPVFAEAGKHKGVSVLQGELRRGLDLMQALTPDQRSAALLAEVKDRNNIMAEAFSDNVDLDYAGLLCDALSEDQTDLLMKLVGEFVGNMADGHAKVKMDEVRQHLDRTYFGWVGGHGDDDVFYYRVHSPVVLIEFDHQRPIAMRLPPVPNPQHIHTVIRTPNGNDYGKDLLRQHYEKSHRAALERAGWTPDL